MLATDAADRRAGRVPRRATLADGREILYFDDAGHDLGPPPPDRRAGGRATTAPSELRHDPLVDEPVLVATHRQGRTHLPRAADCPLCPTRAGRATEVPASAYDVVVFENRFPSLPATQAGRAPVGRSEVLCFTSDHAASFSALPAERLETLAAAWVHRTVALESLPGVAYVLAFENRGEEIGVTLHHPHGQIYAYPYLPPRLGRMLETAERAEACIGCEELGRELSGERIVAEDHEVVAYVPRAARWPFEVHVVPRHHAPSLVTLDVTTRTAITARAADLAGRLDRLFDRQVPYMAGWLTAPVGCPAERWHLRLQLITPQRDADKLKYLAGSESLAGAFINDVRPEDAARRLREIGPTPQT